MNLLSAVALHGVPLFSRACELHPPTEYSLANTLRNIWFDIMEELKIHRELRTDRVHRESV